jgi:hypothetical protein
MKKNKFIKKKIKGVVVDVRSKDRRQAASNKTANLY